MKFFSYRCLLAKNGEGSPPIFFVFKFAAWFPLVSAFLQSNWMLSFQCHQCHFSQVVSFLFFCCCCLSVSQWVIEPVWSCRQQILYNNVNCGHYCSFALCLLLTFILFTQCLWFNLIFCLLVHSLLLVVWPSPFWLIEHHQRHLSWSNRDWKSNSIGRKALFSVVFTVCFCCLPKYIDRQPIGRHLASGWLDWLDAQIPDQLKRTTTKYYSQKDHSVCVQSYNASRRRHQVNLMIADQRSLSLLVNSTNYLLFARHPTNDLYKDKKHYQNW